VHAVGFILKSIDLNGVLVDLGQALRVSDHRHGHGYLLSHVEQQARKLNGFRYGLLNLVEQERIGSSLDVINHIV
jgi:hypothetical protein